MPVDFGLDFTTSRVLTSFFSYISSASLMHYLAKAAVSKYYRLDGENNRNLYSLSPKGWKSKLKVPVGWVTGEVTQLSFSVCPMAFLCAH